MTSNTNKTKFMIIKSKNITYDTFIYDNSLEEVPSYKYLWNNIHHKISWNYSPKKMINQGWKAYYRLGKNFKSMTIWICDKQMPVPKNLITLVV